MNETTYANVTNTANHISLGPPQTTAVTVNNQSSLVTVDYQTSTVIVDNPNRLIETEDLHTLAETEQEGLPTVSVPINNTNAGVSSG